MMMAAEQCWRADEALQQHGENSNVQLFGGELVGKYIDTEIELNWLFNILAGLAVYYLAIGILVHRDAQRSLEQKGPRIIEMVAACGVELQPVQSGFLQRVEEVLWLADKQGPWTIQLDPEQLKTLKQKVNVDDRVNDADKRAIDALFARLIGTALQELASGLDA